MLTEARGNARPWSGGNLQERIQGFLKKGSEFSISYELYNSKSVSQIAKLTSELQRELPKVLLLGLQ